MNLFTLKNKVIVISGGAGFLGGQIALYLSSQEARVRIVDRDEDRIKMLCEKDTGIKGFTADLADEAAMQQTIADIAAGDGRIDVLINCAALKSKAFFSGLEEFSLEDWDAVMRVNLTSFFLLTRETVKVMKGQQYGSIINLSSIYGISGPDESIYEGTSILTPPVYAASKGGVVGFTRYLATTLARHGIRANVLTPGGIQDQQEPRFIENYSKRCPMGRMGTPQDLLGGIHYLASDASGYVTGQNLVIDGGWTAW